MHGIVDCCSKEIGERRTWLTSTDELISLSQWLQLSEGILEIRATLTSWSSVDSLGKSRSTTSKSVPRSMTNMTRGSTRSRLLKDKDDEAINCETMISGACLLSYNIS